MESRKRVLRCLWLVIHIALGLAVLPRVDAPHAAGGRHSSEVADLVTQPPPDLGDGWQLSTPAAEGLDVRGLSAVYAQAKSMPYLHSFLVVRHGKLVSEWYFGGYTAHAADNVKSIAKSLLSALVGIALREGYLTSLDQPLKTFVPEYFVEALEPRKHAITLKHLLAMSSGLASTDDRYTAWRESLDWVADALNAPLLAAPGTAFHYSTGNSHLLAVALTKALGMSPWAFAHRYLFEPMGMQLMLWKTDPHGFYRGGDDMYLRPRDLAKFGLLYLHNGRYNGQQIVPAPWVTDSTATHILGGDVEYGYSWWKTRFEDHAAFFALGYGGQYIVVVPSLDLVVVTTAEWCTELRSEEQHYQAIRELIALCVREAIKKAS